MSVDGLRAWIGEVERKLTMRTRVFLVLAVLAIGAAGAALYFAIDTHDDAVSEGDVQALQQQLEGQSGTGATAEGTDTAQIESEIAELRSRLDTLESGDGGSHGASGGTGTGGDAGDSGAGLGTGDSGGASDGGAASPVPSTPSKLPQVLQEAQERAAKAK